MQIRRLALSVVAGLAIAGPATAEPRNLTSDEKIKVLHLLDLMEEMAQKGGFLDDSLDDTFNQDGDPGGDNDVEYEPEGTTFEDAIDELRRMLDQNRIQADPDVGRGASTRPASGTDNDQIRISESILQILCGTRGAPEIEGVEPDARIFESKMQLLASLSNELVHVFQVFRGIDLEQCDAERDSDTATILILCAVIDQLAGANAVSDVSPADCPKLAACLMKAGIDTDGELADAKDVLGSLKQR